MKYEVSSFLLVGGKMQPISECNLEPPDLRYIEGAIEWTVGRQQIMTHHHWDLVDQLWSYLLYGIGHLLDGEPYKTCFPDQPLELSMELAKSGRMVKFRLDEDEYLLPSAIVSESITTGAREFFSKMGQLVPSMSETFAGEATLAEKLHREGVKSFGGA